MMDEDEKFNPLSDRYNKRIESVLDATKAAANAVSNAMVALTAALNNVHIVVEMCNTEWNMIQLETEGVEETWEIEFDGGDDDNNGPLN